MSKKRFELLNDAQWELIEPLLPEPKRRKDKRGRPWSSNRACLEGILWVLQTGAAWRFLPDKYPSPATCWRRLKQCEEQDVWLEAWRALLGALDGEGSAEVGRDVPGRQLRPGEKGGSAVGKTKRGKGTKWMVLVDGGGLPLGVFGSKVPLREKLRLRKPRSPKSKSPVPKAAHARSRNA
jgi:transposase